MKYRFLKHDSFIENHINYVYIVDGYFIDGSTQFFISSAAEIMKTNNPYNNGYEI